MTVTKLSYVVRMAEASASKKARIVDCWTQPDASHVINILFTDGSKKEMHAPPGKLEMDWEFRPEHMAWQGRISPFRA